MKATVVVSTYNRNDDLIRCLDSLKSQSYPDFDVIVVNGGEIEPVRKIASDYPGHNIKVIEQKRKGVVEARNLGWRNSDADIICFIDDDIVTHPNWLREVISSFSESENIGGVSGPTIIPKEKREFRDQAILLQRFLTTRNILLKTIGKIYINLVLENKIFDVGRILRSGSFTPGSNFETSLKIPNTIEVDYLEACHMCFRRFLLEKIGGFDYAYTGTGEWNEPDFSFKVRKLGYRLVFNPKAVTEHHISQGGVFKKRTKAYERSKNFIHFYFQNVKPDSMDKIFRFFINLCFINTYWFYKALETNNLDWLNGITGTLTGLSKEVLA